MIGVFEDRSLDFSKNQADGDDLLGDAYEYLMRNFAVEGGKSKGQFYTPGEVSRLIAQLLLSPNKRIINKTTFYDPTCGSGSLLLRMRAEANGKGTIFGQEKDMSTAALARMNMVVHGVTTHEIKTGNTLASPAFTSGCNLKAFDYVVANPPFSDKNWSMGVNVKTDTYGRFSLGVPPLKQGDYAYLLHVIKSLKQGGEGACIFQNGVLSRGGAEMSIRRNLIEQGCLSGVISLPPNLFYGTSIPACIILLQKDPGNKSRNVFFIDASTEFFKDANQNFLREKDVRRVVDAFRTRRDIPNYARMVPFEEIKKNAFDLSVSRYIKYQPSEDNEDLDAHLNGGIPMSYIDTIEKSHKMFSCLRPYLFKPLRKGYLSPCYSPEKIHATVLSHQACCKFKQKVRSHFNKWAQQQITFLHDIGKGCHIKPIISQMGDSILSHYEKGPIDKYNAYQHLMAIWNETMQDDLHIISTDGWMAIPEDVATTKVNREWECDLIPKQIISSLYFDNALKFAATKSEKIDMDRKIRAHYGKLSEIDVKEIVIQHKWLSNLGRKICGEVKEIVDDIAARLHTCHGRYKTPIGDLSIALHERKEKVLGGQEIWKSISLKNKPERIGSKTLRSRWTTKKLGEIAHIKKGDAMTKSKATRGDIPVISGGMLPTCFHNRANRQGKTITISDVGDGFVNFYNTPIFAAHHCLTISEGKYYSIDFLYYYLKFRQKDISALKQGSALQGIKSKDLGEILVHMPPLEEQEKIAATLSDINFLMESHKKSMIKWERIEKCMMKDLLAEKQN